MSSNLRQKEPVSTSMFYMWRCIIVIAHADGKIHDKEREYLHGVFGNMSRAYTLTDEQKAIFDDDLVNPKKIADLLPYINDPAFRSQLIYFGGLLAFIDGEAHPSERAILDKLRADQLASLDMEQIRKEVRAAVQGEMMEHDIKALGIRPDGGLIGLIDRFLLWLGIDVLSE